MKKRIPRETRLYDVSSRQRKAAKILAVLERTLGGDLSALRCLDVGCASGLITRALAPRLRWVVGLELDPQSVAQMNAEALPNLLFVRADATRAPLPDASVDLVVCAQVYEHVDAAERLVAEIARVLAPGGVCFFSGPNRLAPIEEHYGLPFLSWLPRPLASALLRWIGRGDAYRERPRTYWGLRRLWRGFELEDYTLEIMRHPEAYSVAETMGRLAWVGRLPRAILRALQPFYPNYNWVLRKPSEGPR